MRNHPDTTTGSKKNLRNRNAGPGAVTHGIPALWEAEAGGSLEHGRRKLQ